MPSLPTLNRFSLAVSLTVAAAAVGLLDVVLLWALMGFARCWDIVAHDPGKFLFHLVILPCATFLLLSDYPKRAKRVLNGHAAAGFMVLVLAGSFVSGFADSVTSFQGAERVPWPSEFDDGDAREVLWGHKTRLNSDIGDSSNDPVADKKDYLANVPPELAPGKRKWLSDMSTRSQWAAFLSGLGAAFGGFVFTTILLLVVSRQPAPPPSASQTKTDDQLRHDIVTLALTLGLLLIWIPARIYSEWYASFGDFDPAVYQPVVLVVIVMGVCGVLLFFKWDFERKALPYTVFGVGAAIIGTVANIELELFPWAARWLSSANLSTTLTLYFVLICFCVALTVLGVQRVRPAPQSARAGPPSAGQQPQQPGVSAPPERATEQGEQQ